MTVNSKGICRIIDQPIHPWYEIDKFVQRKINNDSFRLGCNTPFSTAGLAQSVERMALNHTAVGSTPTLGIFEFEHFLEVWLLAVYTVSSAGFHFIYRSYQLIDLFILERQGNCQESDNHGTSSYY